MANTIAAPLRALLMAMNLGRSTSHPLAGWQLLSILYRDGSTSGEPMTMGYLVRRYNAAYLEPNEDPVADAGLRAVLKILVDQAHLVSETTRKVRERMVSGKFHIIQSAVYRINAAGIEYLKAMQHVIDAENTVVASTKRIQEFCDLLDAFQDYRAMATSTIDMYEDFIRMLSAYEDVTNGLRKLDVDLHDISSDLAFDRSGAAAAHLQTMLHKQAIPAYEQMLAKSVRLLNLRDEQQFAQMVATSRQASGNLDVAVAVGDAAALEIERSNTAKFVRRRLNTIARSFEPGATAIQNSFDSIYLLYQTLIDASDLLAREYEHVHRQTVDLRALTADIDALMPKASRIIIPASLPVHLPMDRLGKAEMDQINALPPDEQSAAMAELTSSVRADMLEAGAMEPVTRPITEAVRPVVTVADNPEVAADADLAADDRAAIAEFTQKCLVGPNTVAVTHDLELVNSKTRDTIVALYPATQYHNPSSFSAFGRMVSAAQVIAPTPVRVHLQGDDYVAVLPQGFRIEFATEG